MDGTIKLLDFEEIGNLLTAKEMGDLCEKKYGFRPLVYGDVESNLNPKQSIVIDDIDQYRKLHGTEKVNDVAKNAGSQNRLSAVMSSPEPKKQITQPPKTMEQMEFRTKSGKKKITPVYLGPLESAPTKFG